MKFVYTAFLLLFVANLLQAQTLRVAPATSNPALRSFAAQKETQNAQLVEELTGKNPLDFTGGDRSATCPPELEGNFVVSGSSIEIEIDTFGLMNGEEQATVTLENGSGLLFGSANFADTTLILTYTSTSGLTGANTETVQFKLSQPGHDTIFSVEIKVRRKARILVTASQTVQRESITTFCLGNELDFAKPKACAASTDEVDGYDGRAFIYQHLSSYDYPDTCLVYYASRFPGVDTVSMTICDEWGVCDVFKVPYIIPGDTLSIATQPFFDDFSSYDGPYPTPDLWLDDNVFRNNTLAKDPPSVGLVTFDGLSHRGKVYDIVTGVGDRLTSKAIDLSTFNPNSDVFLRFFLAPKGYGLPPDDFDNMVLEFRNSNREWVTAGTYQGIGSVPIDSLPPFLFYAIKVDDPQFFHEAFQFRFSANTSPGGVVDLWHLDYVRLSSNEGGDERFSEIAITALPTSPLRNYTALPWRHFSADIPNEVRDGLESHFYNHFDEVLAIAESSVTYKELTTGANLTTAFPVIEGGSESNLAPMVHETRNRTIPSSNFSGLQTALGNIPEANLRVLQTQYAIRPSTTQQFGFTSNDTVRINNVFSNYFAHDDGTAEWQVYIEHATGVEQFASKFHANVSDTLRYVQIMFPHVNGDVTTQLFNLKIWAGSLDSEPLLYRQLLKPFYPSQVYDTLQGFTTYLLDDFVGEATPVVIPEGDFYVGFEQANSATLGIPIGFDVQNPCECSWANLNGVDWSPFPSSIAGALMIRPVFGETRATSGTAEPTKSAANLEIFPNPTTGLVQISLPSGKFDDYRVAVFNQIGQAMHEGVLAQRLDLGNLANGIYFVQILNEKTGELQAERIVLAKD